MASARFALIVALAVCVALLLHVVARLAGRQGPHPAAAAPPPPREQPPSAASLPSAAGWTFWHVTDWHLNPYHMADGDVRDMCRSHTSDPTRRPGPFGHFNCDPSIELARAAIARMAAADPNPAFILLGGDNFGHVPPARENGGAVAATHEAVVSMLARAFPTAPILPVVGNHDTWPYFDAGGRGADDTRARLSALCARWLGARAAERLRSSGYYDVALRLPAPDA